MAARLIAAVVIYAASMGVILVGGRDHVSMRPIGSDSVVRAIAVDGASIPLDSFTTFRDVESLLGSARALKPSGHLEAWNMCFKGQSNPASEFLVLQSNELGGLEHRVLGFMLSKSIPAGLAPRDCTTATRPFGIVETDNHIHLGSPIDSVLKIMGTPRSHVGGTYGFQYVRNVPRTATSSEYDITATLEVRVLNGRVIYVAAWYVETT